MLDLNEVPEIPNYEVKIEEEVKSFDAMKVGYKLRVLEGEIDPETIQEVVCKALEIDVDAYKAHVILKDFYDFAEEHMKEPLKKVFGLELFSTTITDSAPENSKSSSPESI